MEFKVLKHKTLEDTFGIFHAGDNPEIWQRSIPHLFKMNMTMEYLKQSNKNYMAYTQLNDYELVTVEVKLINN